jgi:hypothetical protein
VAGGLGYFLAVAELFLSNPRQHRQDSSSVGASNAAHLVMVGTWSAIVLTLLHTLGGVSWSALGLTGPIIVMSALAWRSALRRVGVESALVGASVSDSAGASDCEPCQCYPD